ncbi:MAG: DUF839 domain-containing protein [Woronichinia naegeliana WA131]|uniref:DUF839 domain-containing protein n=1 Tax=Woronichinia naegeliana WA131 TaxID=2824559 RepID=A0A977PWK8_9CYAN|nr:MAG: DUF839 domain-containing protein [Woronichinia naegeliana WA131]
MSNVSRRQILYFLGGSAGVAVLDSVLGGRSTLLPSASAQTASFTPVRVPHPLDIYQEKSSWLSTGVGTGETLPPATNPNLSSFSVTDDVVVPPEFERYVIVQWGDRVFPDADDYFGYNCDYTGFVPLNGDNAGLLWVNHEYVSFPISTLAPGTPSDLATFPTSFAAVIGFNLPTATSVSALSPTDRRLLFGEFLYNLGGSVVRIQKNRQGRYQVQRDPRNRRLTGLSGLAINASRSDAYKTVISWGVTPHQQGNYNYLVGTGPASIQVFNLSTDGLGNRIIGTAYNCSGGTTPWGTVLSGEENFQGDATFFVGVTEAVQPNGTQTAYISGTTGAEFGLVGEKYGWMVEIDPATPSVRAKKHTALGRFRHENIGLRAEAGKKLIAYMGDDRRGGHTYKFVSSGTINSNLANKNNSQLFENGTLYVAKYNADGCDL